MFQSNCWNKCGCVLAGQDAELRLNLSASIFRLQRESSFEASGKICFWWVTMERFISVHRSEDEMRQGTVYLLLLAHSSSRNGHSQSWCCYKSYTAKLPERGNMRGWRRQKFMFIELCSNLKYDNLCSIVNYCCRNYFLCLCIAMCVHMQSTTLLNIRISKHARKPI